MNLSGKRVLITAGVRRVGAVIAARLATAGCQLIIHCRKSTEETEKFLASLPGASHRIITADLSRPSEIDDLCCQAGTFELLVNNAALFHRPDSAEDLAAANDYHQVNFLAPKQLAEYFFSQDIAEGAVVNITDCFALRQGKGAYWQSKYDLNMLTKTLAPLWATRNLRINAVAPGPMLPPPWAPGSKMEKILQQVPLHRRIAVDDTAAAVEFLLRCDSITGAVVPVDGGISVS